MANLIIQLYLHLKIFKMNKISIMNLIKKYVLKRFYRTIDCLKRNKTTGLEGIIADLFIDCKDVLTPVLLRLFIFIYDNGVYPEQLKKGVTIPVRMKTSMVSLTTEG